METLLAQNPTVTPFGKAFGSPFQELPDVGRLASVLLNNALTLAGILLLVLMILGGLGVVMGAGSDNPEQAAKGRQAVTAAVVGFLIIFAAYWIIQVIELLTGIKILGQK